ncbi:hypothetical protein Aca07nite_84500 [Actinoplanes capillaceus]|uniref:Excreted virulence factor EspC, type VII ESX diderm n=1 Tax=Actinoplanes campanulatus TaxID=113559 RepID=A0ABQ3WY28_9ACTN|nr:hypothetical protein [Actinoplanes capillaceus]GID51175.1 hypothetical protein Aca07nite_84500 [Actinoplanes capillaceus]
MSSGIPTPPFVTADTGEAAFTAQQVLDALNTAADDILAAVDAGDSGLRDGINLMVNATIAYLRGDADDLRTVAANSYGEDISDILDWIREATS